MYKYKEILTLYPVMYMVFFTASTVQIYVIANIRGGRLVFYLIVLDSPRTSPSQEPDEMH